MCRPLLRVGTPTFGLYLASLKYINVPVIIKRAGSLIYDHTEVSCITDISNPSPFPKELNFARLVFYCDNFYCFKETIFKYLKIRNYYNNNNATVKGNAIIRLLKKCIQFSAYYLSYFMFKQICTLSVTKYSVNSKVMVYNCRCYKRRISES